MENATEEATVTEITDTTENDEPTAENNVVKKATSEATAPKMMSFKQPQMKIPKGIKHPPTASRHST